ncbi:hypothetical protein GAYE_SCF07G2831 [Galdieria yellowstonensis]|uniref:Peroxisomal membrane protein 11B n=1 Tax=Galdieria yellowstonensis TaxID=3028027 RepID=A0AAV9IC53_9RHOD|nr:hypothetical protein GAYE_SCF07G2831 [Galdieria yellowstonensis]
METCAVLLADVDKRDKIYRTIQYLCKLWCALPYGSSETNLGVRKLAKVLSSARQVLRLGKSIQVWNKIYHQPKLVDQVSFSLVRLTDFSFFFYFLFDNIAWLYRSGLVSGKETGPRRKATEFYLSGAIFNLLENIRQLWKIIFIENYGKFQRRPQNEVEGQLQSSTDSKYEKIRKQRLYRTILTCIRLLLDIIVAFNILRDDTKDTVFNGFCGSLSSLIALSLSWPRKAIGE